MPLPLQHPAHRDGAGHADALAPMNQPLGRPLGLGLVPIRQVLGHGGKAPWVRAAPVAGHALSAVHHLHGARRDAQLQRHAHQGVGHAVAVGFKLDVAVNVHAHGFEDRPLPGLQRQRHQGRSINFLEHAGPAARQLLEGALVEVLEQRGQGVVDLVDAGELVLAQPRQDPALHQLHAELDLGFVLRVVGPRGQHRAAVVAGKVEHGVVELWLVAVGVFD